MLLIVHKFRLIEPGLEQPPERDPDQGPEPGAKHAQGPRPLRQPNRHHFRLSAEPGEYIGCARRI